MIFEISSCESAEQPTAPQRPNESLTKDRFHGIAELDVSYETVRRWVLKFGPLFAESFAVDARPNTAVASRQNGRDNCGAAVLALARG
jgi:hypothetical protein